MDEIDKKILNLIQEEFPLHKRPYKEIGRQVNIDEKEAVKRVQKLKDAGVIRRIGVVFEPKKLDYTSTLCGVHVDEKNLMEVVDVINKHTGVTHNYEREGDLNLWFTIIANKEEEIDAFISDLERRFLLKIYRFPKKRVFKIKTFFPV
ncbi:MAG: Lrp/AsnC family transcriptional regulator [Syntrophorhabdus sp.]|jgi:DNA-binding Lrp family transcriptional regulator|nr:Lrp/AsnC family transcriptional regulator [Syntrophorhabdus sp.]MDI9559097.1 Lrp/AsnC family transcriptional regulator [Pseudomonadota bacterium]NMC94619.1 Lrp/AsnC family transcriptional regulator [Syntrophorhabdus sp.]HNQ47353.1 Lrp/AsnC family transcriptional regulator [Syntrophorhabdus sp.]HNY71522.1 Lrp/AsnC family transcriptional regulator [Syntrophorhabdus sp.]